MPPLLSWLGQGPNPPSLDPNISAGVQFGHTTSPQTMPISVLTRLPLLPIPTGVISAGYSQQFLTGTAISASYSGSRSFYNSPSPTLNPYINADLDFTISQSLLQGFSHTVNNRQIRVAKNNIKVR